MFPIVKQEFTSSFKSIKAILLILFLTITSVFTASYLTRHPELLAGVNQPSAYTSSIKFFILFFGFLFVAALSHDIINREIETRTIRLLVTKTSRLRIVLEKFLGSLLFWCATLTINFLIVSLYAQQWFWMDYLTVLIVILYITSFNIFLSTMIAKPGLTMFLGIFLGVVVPIIGLWSAFSEKWYLVPFQYILPYHAVIMSGTLLLLPVLWSGLFLTVSYLTLKRKDL
ncbi:hypothetical protein ESP131_09765 [Exiguobacterium sp. U13-1]|uniref:ABC transporter permease subunit n=1 Tax=Exiguobacterium acetylicum TaxID=41170 RepID=A0ABX8GD00_EXIAC|nr:MULTISPECIES: ABC transporter permease subunit [Exiguobacterium]AOT00526.1 hypothetical protein ESP131_09765 [Exiguobacterium sp. U13-1]QWB31490.1 ABC transporter permease subunit [Exiguobacterium acetylicum]